MEARWKCQPSHVLIGAEVLQSREQNSASTEVSANELRMRRDVQLIEITLQSLTKTLNVPWLSLPCDFKRWGSEIPALPWLFTAHQEYRQNGLTDSVNTQQDQLRR